MVGAALKGSNVPSSDDEMIYVCDGWVYVLLCSLLIPHYFFLFFGILLIQIPKRVVVSYHKPGLTAITFIMADNESTFSYFGLFPEFLLLAQGCNQVDTYRSQAQARSSFDMKKLETQIRSKLDSKNSQVT